MTTRAPRAARIFFAVAVAAAGASRAADSVPSYTADPAASHLDFVGVQAGAEFKGTFHKFTAAVDFSPDAVANSHLDVQIDLNSVDTKDNDRDKTLRGPDIYDIAHYPTAHYVTRSITKTATGYSAAGALTLHGVTHPNTPAKRQAEYLAAQRPVLRYPAQGESMKRIQPRDRSPHTNAARRRSIFF